jgi:hypothetical protein
MRNPEKINGKSLEKINGKSREKAMGEGEIHTKSMEKPKSLVENQQGNLWNP